MHTRANYKSALLTLPLIMMGALLVSCKSKQAPIAKAPVFPPVQEAVAPVVEEPKEKPVYVYSGDRFRDPFTPAGQMANYQPDAVFDPHRASVKGIIFGASFRSAVLQVGGSGTYFITDGRIFDIMGKPIEGYTAKIYADKVELYGEAENMFELKIRNEGEEEKS